ncbi:MAG: hypothetical protein RLZZ175_1182 [Bacteroidota bacterium]|jgi:phosphoadenosine phosphosulfate reductase
MTVEEIEKYILKYKSEGLKMFTTSSFQTHSIVLLHILSKIDNTIPVYFINTGFLFPETVAYKDTIKNAFGLNVIDVLPSTPKLMQKDNQGKFLFTSDPDYCCYINKVLPMEPLLLENDVWINGVRADQSAVRKGFNIEEKAKHGVTRYHPMLDWNGRMISQYIRENNLPKHPLEDKGYLSIGCEPCTRLLTPEMAEREARWYGMNKTECGLNTDLVQK